MSTDPRGARIAAHYMISVAATVSTLQAAIAELQRGADAVRPTDAADAEDRQAAIALLGEMASEMQSRAHAAMAGLAGGKRPRRRARKRKP